MSEMEEPLVSEMTLLDWFACKAMASMIREAPHTPIASRASLAYEQADAMMAARDAWLKAPAPDD